MRVGIFLNDYHPEDGGANSLLNTIQNDFFHTQEKDYEYVFLYEGRKNSKRKYIKDGFTYYNIDCYISGLTKIRNNKLTRYISRMFTKQSMFDRIAKEENIDLFWFPQPVKYEINHPYIYTVWDLGHRRTPYFPEVSRQDWTWDDRESLYKKMLYKASFIITGNEEGKKEILENYPMPPQKIRIVEFPVASFCRGKETKPEFDIPQQSFFYPAQFWAHKNHICILKALKILNDEYHINPMVFFTGSDKGNKNYIVKKISEYNLEKQIKFTGFISDEELKYLYTHTTAMIFASLMGPNNMPPIEATYLKCPVIITNLDGHKEQLQDTALYFDGYNPTELSKQMYRILTDDNLRTQIKEKQKVLAKSFDSINYFANIKKIIDDFALIRQTWE